MAGHVYEVTTGLVNRESERMLMSAQKAPTYYDGSFTQPAEVMAGNEARPRPPARRAQRAWSLA